MTDVVVQVAEYLAEKTGRTMGEDMFYYQMPTEVNVCAVVQRTKSGRAVPAVIDAGVHALRIAARATSSTTAYEMAQELYEALDVTDDEYIGDQPGFIELEETRAQITLYDAPQFQEQDQQGRKVFEFFALLTTKR